MVTASNFQPQNIVPNLLALADALALVERVNSGTIDLCYVDPPLFPDPEGSIEDNSTWVMRDHLLSLAKILQQARRCLAKSGNIFVHSEPEMNGSVRLLLDQIFGRDNFRQEAIVPRQVSRNTRHFSSGHDTVFHYSIGSDFLFNPELRSLDPKEIDKQFSSSDKEGRFRLVTPFSKVTRPTLIYEWNGYNPPTGRSWRYSKEQMEELYMRGRVALATNGSDPKIKQYASEIPTAEVGTLWDDLPLLPPVSERVSYPQQKSERLVERIIRMGTNEGGVILDPFCGSGTTIVVANKINRRWIGGDNSVIAIEATHNRLKQECQSVLGHDHHFVNEQELRSNFNPHHFAYKKIFTGFDDFVAEPLGSFILNDSVEVEETRVYEFKQVTSKDPSNTIANTADEYAVAFLNSEGGSIFWGVRDVDRVVVGVRLTFKDRDRLRRLVTEKLGAIRPAIDPTMLRLQIHPIRCPTQDSDLVIVELNVPTVLTSRPYFTGSNEAFVRLDGVKRKLAGPELIEWALSRMVEE